MYALKAMAEDLGLELTLLVDVDAEVIRAYGVLNESDRKGRAIPHPTVVVVDRDRVVRWLHSDDNYRERPPAELVLEAIDRLLAADAP